MNQKGFIRKIIENNLYLSLATCDGKIPWIAVVQYVVDEKYNFYFISARDSLHGQHILKNPTVAFTIFDSHQAAGTGDGIQVLGKACVLSNVKYPAVVVKYFDALTKIPINLERYVVFEIKPVRFYVPDTGAWKKEGVDRRREVKFI